MSDAFEETLDALERERERIEGAFRQALEALDERVARLQQAAAEAERVARASRAGSPAAPADVAAPPSPPAVGGGWPGGRGARGLLNRLSAWVLRDYWHALDRRADALVAALAAQARWSEATTEALAAHGAQLQRAAARAEGAAPRELVEAVREAVNRAAEMADLLGGVHERMLDLVNAKEAETLQRAVHGPLHKMELMFEEFARQQEALLAELVGRRQRLEALVHRAEEAARRAEEAGGRVGEEAGRGGNPASR